MRLLGKTCFLRKVCSVLTSYSFRKKKLKPIPFVLQYRLYCFLSFFNYHFLVVITYFHRYLSPIILLFIGLCSFVSCIPKYTTFDFTDGDRKPDGNVLNNRFLQFKMLYKCLQKKQNNIFLNHSRYANKSSSNQPGKNSGTKFVFAS